MPRPKQPKKQQKRNLKEFIEGYDKQILYGALETFKTSTGWDVLRAFLQQRQREFEVAALDLIRSNGHTQDAAYASGYAMAIDDLLNRDINELEGIVLGQSGVIEAPMPEDN